MYIEKTLKTKVTKSGDLYRLVLSSACWCRPQYAEHTLKTTKATQVLMSRSGSALNLSQWDYELTSGVDVHAEEVASNAGLHQVYKEISL
jgi:hypothetical protein